MKSIAHIFLDTKFVYEVKYYENEGVENKIFLLSKKSKEGYININPKSDYIKFFKRELLKFDEVILYQLDNYKINLVNKISHPNYVWRFFGTEIYSLFLEDFISEKTKKALAKEQTKPSFFQQLKTSLDYRIRKLIYNYDFNFLKAIKKINVFLGLYRKEYDLISERYFLLPKFRKLNLTFHPRENLKKKENTIILGNSRNTFNNHIDVLDIFNKVNLKDYKIIIPFNYGFINSYTKTVEENISNNSSFELLNKFVDYDIYMNYFANAKCYINNAYRQFGVGNIYIAIFSGCKIYLNEKNICYHIYKKLGLLVFSIEQSFYNDLKNKELMLTEEQMRYNINQAKRTLFYLAS